MNLFVTAIFMLLACVFFETATCLPAVNPQNSSGSIRVTSTSKNGGHSKTFFFIDQQQQQQHQEGDDSIGPLHHQDDYDSRKSSSKSHRFKSNPTTLVRKIKSGIRSTFLPSGYPSRTPPGYMKYSIWSWVQDLSTQLRSVLATQRVLEGVGVGKEGATALSALMNFLVRDGCGMGATLLFTSVASYKFRTDVKRWRLFADMMVDLGITLEVTAVMLPQVFFLPMISIGNMCKAICGVAAGACGGSINLHWSKGSDISDINAKFGAQHTVTGAIGLICAALFARSVNHVNSIRLWTLYAGLTLLHVYANMQCMRLIAFDSCNTIRMNLILEEFFPWWKKHYKNPEVSTFAQPPSTLLSKPDQIAKIEPLFFGIPVLRRRKKPAAAAVPIHFGCSFNEFWERSSQPVTELNNVISNNNTKDKYLISSGSMKNGKPCVAVVLLSHAEPLQEAKAYFHANLLAVELEKTLSSDTSHSTVDENIHLEAEIGAREQLENAWGIFQACCDGTGWDLGKTELCTKGYEVELSTSD